MMNLNYDMVLDLVNDVLLAHDLAGLIIDEEMQQDEYMAEAKEIVGYIKSQEEIDTMKFSKFIQDLFIKYFETEYPLDYCADTAWTIIVNLDKCAKEVK